MTDRGLIPRLLSSIYRKGRKVEKDTASNTRVQVDMSYYEIYNDKVFDLFEPCENRTPAGLPIRDNNGKTVIAGLTERPCTTLKQFEIMYDEANLNRSTSATKLNAHSSRSHAVLCVKVSQIAQDRTIASTISAIDLAGSEDNRRTDNGKERLVESSAINKSLFVLAQCVEAISKKQARIPYRESKMTRILSLGQNNGLTVMILNLAPVRSYHLDTLSSLNFANRTKKVEIREIENEPIFRTTNKKPEVTHSAITQPRRPLQSLPTAANVMLTVATTTKSKPAKTFSVYAERNRLSSDMSKAASFKRGSDAAALPLARPHKILKAYESYRPPARRREPELSRASIEDLVNRMVEEKLASRINDSEKTSGHTNLSEEVQRRLNALEERVEKQHDSRAEGLQYLLMAKQHQVHGEDASAMRMYELARPFFPENERLMAKMIALREKMQGKRHSQSNMQLEISTKAIVPARLEGARQVRLRDDSDSDHAFRDEADAGSSDDDFYERPRKKRRPLAIYGDTEAQSFDSTTGLLSPRTSHLLHIINTRDASQIRSLKGVGSKKADVIVSSLCALDENEAKTIIITNLAQLGGMKGVGPKSVEAMRLGLLA